MRESLKYLNRKSREFEATYKDKRVYKDFGKHKEIMLLFLNVLLDGKEVTDNVWIFMCREFEWLSLVPGDRIRFTAQVRTYTKGDSYDFKLCKIRRAKKYIGSFTINLNYELKIKEGVHLDSDNRNALG